MPDNILPVQTLALPEADEFTVAVQTNDRFPSKNMPGTVTYWRNGVAVCRFTDTAGLERLRQGWKETDSTAVEREQP